MAAWLQSIHRLVRLTPMSAGAWAHTLGFLAGWAMFLDYLVIPLINTVYCSLTLQRIFPAIPYAVWAVLFVVIITGAQPSRHPFHGPRQHCLVGGNDGGNRSLRRIGNTVSGLRRWLGPYFFRTNLSTTPKPST